jgi:hypothetical protein
MHQPPENAKDDQDHDERNDEKNEVFFILPELRLKCIFHMAPKLNVPYKGMQGQGVDKEWTKQKRSVGCNQGSESGLSCRT